MKFRRIHLAALIADWRRTLLSVIGVALGVTVVLGVLIAVAMFANLIIAGVVGAVVPLMLRKLRLDPALSSGPIVTTFTDVCGYLIFLGLATLMLGWLVAG